MALAAMLALLAGGLERERRAEGGAEGALLQDGWRLRITSAQVAEDVAAEGYARTLRDYSSRDVLDSDAYLTELVGSVAEPLIVAAKELYPQTSGWAWEWHLADTNEINAYCMPGGRIVVLSGLLSEPVLGDDRDMLATILAHEVSHAILQHTRESMGREWLAQGLAWTMAKSLKIGAVREQEMVKSLKQAFLDPKSRILETEADILGLELMTRAGFDPAKAVTTWERMAGRGNAAAQGAMTQRALAFLSDHPSDSDRLARMTELQSKAIPLAAKSKHWEWALQGISDRQAAAMEATAGAYGLAPNQISVTETSLVSTLVARAEGISPRQAAKELNAAIWEAGLSQGGALQMGMTAMVRGVGGWERLERIGAAWTRLGAARGPRLDPAGIARLNLSDEDRAHALAGITRVAAYLESEKLQIRLWRDAAGEIGKTRPKAAEAIRGWLRGDTDHPDSSGGRAGR